MADCLLLAHAISTGDALATSDPDVAAIARARGLTLIALPDRDGNRP
jgi:predicted nucleic acid-binding protein